MASPKQLIYYADMVSPWYFTFIGKRNRAVQQSCNVEVGVLGEDGPREPRQ